MALPPGRRDLRHPLSLPSAAKGRGPLGGGTLSVGDPRCPRLGAKHGPVHGHGAGRGGGSGFGSQSRLHAGRGRQGFAPTNFGRYGSALGRRSGRRGDGVVNRSAGPMTPADKAPPEVVTVGNMVADVIVHPLRPFPAVGQIEYVDSISLQPGGNGVNTAVALRKLGVRVAAVGRVGDDRFGDFLVHAMEEVGVDVQAVARDERATAVTLAG